MLTILTNLFKFYIDFKIEAISKNRPLNEKSSLIIKYTVDTPNRKISTILNKRIKWNRLLIGIVIPLVRSGCLRFTSVVYCLKKLEI